MTLGTVILTRLVMALYPAHALENPQPV
jgi:hypothetical protein